MLSKCQALFQDSIWIFLTATLGGKRCYSISWILGCTFLKSRLIFQSVVFHSPCHIDTVIFLYLDTTWTKSLLLMLSGKNKKVQHQDLQNVLKTTVGHSCKKCSKFHTADGPHDYTVKKNVDTDSSEVKVIQKKDTECDQLLGEE